MSLQLSAQGGGCAGKPLIRALHLRNADTGWTAATSWPKRHRPNHPAGKIKSAANRGLCADLEHRAAGRLGCSWGPRRCPTPCASCLALQRPAHPPRAAPRRPPQAGPLSRNRREKPSQGGKPRGCGNPTPRSSQAEKGVGWEGHWPPLTLPMAPLRCWDTSPNPLGAGTPTPATAVMQWDRADPGRPRLPAPHPKHKQWGFSRALLPGAFVKDRHHSRSGRQRLHRSPDQL